MEKNKNQDPKTLFQKETLMDNSSTETLFELQKNDYHQYITTIINDNTYSAVVPEEFEIFKNGGIVYNEQDKDGNLKQSFVSDCPIIITSIINNLDTNEQKIEIAALINNQWKVQSFPRSVVYGKPISLSNLGLKISSSNSKLFIKYIIQFELLNKATIPVINAVSVLGWRDRTTFVPFSTEMVVDANYQPPQILNGYTKKGSIDDWAKSIAPFRKNNIFRFVLSSSFASPLLSLMCERPFMVYLHGPSRSGKTSTLVGALSCWGDASKLITTYNTTNVGLEKLLTFNNSLPIALDERQIADSQKSIEKIIFMLASGSRTYKRK